MVLTVELVELWSVVMTFKTSNNNYGPKSRKEQFN